MVKSATHRSRSIALAAALLASLAASFPTAVAAPGDADATPPATEPNEQASRIAALEGYYADTYSQPLADKNRLSQLIAIVSLSRIDGPALTTKLLGALTNQDPLVAQIAWEGLRARYTSLTDEQRSAWISGGLNIAKRGGFPGATIAPLLDAAATVPLARLKNLAEPALLSVAESNDPAVEDGKPGIAAAGRAVAAWGDTRLVQTLVARMNARPALAPRIAAMLSALPNAPAATEDASARRAAWAKFSQTLRLAPPTTRPTYDAAAAAALLPPPVKITDADDPKWRRELELDKLNLDAVELAFCVDGTPSMVDANEFVTAYLETTARLLRIMSEKVRVGTVYYRHEVDPAIMLDCCRKVGGSKQSRDWFTRVLTLTPDATALVQQMRAQKPPGPGESGHNGKGAYVAGITTAMRALQWAPKGTKIIVCTGDAAPTPGSERAMVDTARAAKDNGFLLIFDVEKPSNAEQVAPASRAATGLDPLQYKADVDRLKADKAQEQTRGTTNAIDRFKGSSFEAMTRRVLELSLPNDYRDRVEPLMNAVLPILAAEDVSDRAERLVSDR